MLGEVLGEMLGEMLDRLTGALGKIEYVALKA